MPKSINWDVLYRGFSAKMVKINCGELCSKKNKGIPICCTNELHVPLLYDDELRWQKKDNNGLWKERVSRSAHDKKQNDETVEYLKYCHCAGVAHCQRSKRSLTCRFFPFEPYIAEDGTFVGITYIYRAAKDCPLVDNPDIPVTKAYVKQSIKVWNTIFVLYPNELELYFDQSRKLQREFKKKNKVIKVFSA